MQHPFHKSLFQKQLPHSENMMEAQRFWYGSCLSGGGVRSIMTGGISRQTVEGVTILNLEGSLTAETGALLATTLRAEAEAGKRKFVVDLSTTQRLDSLGLGYLTVALTTVSRRSGIFVLAAPTKKVEKLLETLRLQEVFLIFDSAGTAVEVLKGWTYDDFIAKTRGAWKKSIT